MNKNVELKAVVRKGNEEYFKLAEKIEELKTLLQKQGGNENSGKIKLAVDKAYTDANKALKDYNKLIDKAYYLGRELFAVIKDGQNVPSFELKTSFNEDENKYNVYLNPVKVYPSMRRMMSCGVLPEHTIDKVDLLRREIAYLKSGNKAFLTGNVEEKKDVPSKYVAELIEGEGEISKNKVKATLAIVLKEITGGEYKKEVFNKLYQDFETFMVKRTGKWGERGMVSLSTACDLVLEYAYMYFNNMRAVKYDLV